MEGVLARHLGVKRRKKVQETLAEHLPIEQATPVTLKINLKTAKALGLNLPPMLI